MENAAFMEYHRIYDSIGKSKQIQEQSTRNWIEAFKKRFEAPNMAELLLDRLRDKMDSLDPWNANKLIQ